MGSKSQRLVERKAAQLKALGIEPSFIGGPSKYELALEETGVKPSYVHSPKEYEGLARMMEEREAEYQRYLEENPTRVHEFMNTLGAVLDVVEPGAGAGAKGASLLLGGLPASTMKKLGKMVPGMREVQLGVLKAIRKGTEVGSSLRRGLLEDLKRGAVLQGSVPEGLGLEKALGLYKKQAGILPSQELLKGQLEETFSAVRELNRRADQLDTLGKSVEAKGLRDEAKNLRRWFNRQTKALQKKPGGPLLAAELEKLSPEKARGTMLHETTHAAQRGSPLAMTPEGGGAELGRALETAGHTPAWARSPLEQEARYIEMLGGAETKGIQGAISPRGELESLFGDPIVTAEQAEEIARKLKLKPQMFGSIR